jgi:DNA polymerase elongation subunit (family B)
MSSADEQLADAISSESTASEPRFALDIETYAAPGVEEPSFDAPDEWRILCIAVAYTASDEASETAVLWRADETSEAGADLLMRTVRWFAAHPVGRIYTYNGGSFDWPILHAAAERYAEIDATDRAIETVREFYPHTDLFDAAKAATPGEKWPTLEEACSTAGVTDAALDVGVEVDGSDVPRLASAILRGDAPEAKAAVETYARSDVWPLFELADIYNESDLVA